jgi:hypothetical protein
MIEVGLSPTKARAMQTLDQKLVTIQKRNTTRKALNTRGPKQKQKFLEQKKLNPSS